MLKTKIEKGTTYGVAPLSLLLDPCCVTSCLHCGPWRADESVTHQQWEQDNGTLSRDVTSSLEEMSSGGCCQHHCRHKGRKCMSRYCRWTQMATGCRDTTVSPRYLANPLHHTTKESFANFFKQRTFNHIRLLNFASKQKSQESTPTKCSAIRRIPSQHFCLRALPGGQEKFTQEHEILQLISFCC